MIIDVHAHIAPKHLIPKGGYSLESKDEGYVIHTHRYNVPVTEEMFSTEAQIAAMDKQGVDIRVLCNAPFLMGMEKEGEEAKSWNRECNEFIASCCKAYPKRFMGFCTLPLNSIEDAKEELRYAIGELGLWGVELPTNFRGKNLDEEYFAPLFELLNEMALPVILHPTEVRGGDFLKIGYLGNLLGNPFETGVAAGRMLVSGFFEKYPNVRVQLSHGGGMLPSVFGRIGHKHTRLVDENGELKLPDNLYFDTVVFEKKALAYLADRVENVVLGTDAPFDMAEFYPLELIKSAVFPKRAEEIISSIPSKYMGL